MKPTDRFNLFCNSVSFIGIAGYAIGWLWVAAR